MAALALRRGIGFGEFLRTSGKSWEDKGLRESVFLTQRGIRGFWSGSTMRLGRLVLSGGIVFSVYEQVSAVLVGFTSSRS